MVTSREPDDGLYSSLPERSEIVRLGDCLAPGTIGAAVRSGHRYAREFDETDNRDVPFLRERPEIFG